MVHQLTNNTFQELFTSEASVDKCIILLTESLPVNVLEIKPEFLLRNNNFP